MKAARRPVVVQALRGRLDHLAIALGSRDYLVGDRFTIADMMTSSILKILHHTDILEAYPSLAAFRDRCFDRPAYRKAIADQCADFARHSPQDMKYGHRR